MSKKLSAVILTVAVLLATGGCTLQGKESDSVKSSLAQINEGIEQCSKLENGTIEAAVSMEAKNHAAESMAPEDTEYTSLTTFVRNQMGYDYIEESRSLDKKSGEIRYTAAKRVDGVLFSALPLDPTPFERRKPYEWGELDVSSGKSNAPNGMLKTMMTPSKLFREEYVESITREKYGSWTKYTVTANGAYAKYMKETAHSADENYTVLEHYDIYWMNEEELLIKHQIYDEFEWTVEGIPDTYRLDITAELTGSNYKKLKKIGEEFPPKILFEGELYTQSPALIDVNINALNRIGMVESVVGSVQEPEQNNQANRPIKNAEIYRSGDDAIIVKYIDYTLYNKER